MWCSTDYGSVRVRKRDGFFPPKLNWENKPEEKEKEGKKPGRCMVAQKIPFAGLELGEVGWIWGQFSLVHPTPLLRNEQSSQKINELCLQTS